MNLTDEQRQAVHERRAKEDAEFKESLKQQLSDTLTAINKLNRMLLRADCGAVRDSLDDASRAIRPMLYVMRSMDENARQREIDCRT